MNHLTRISLVLENLAEIADGVLMERREPLLKVTLEDGPEGMFIRPESVVGLTIKRGDVEIFTKAGTRLSLPLRRVNPEFLAHMLPKEED